MSWASVRIIVEYLRCSEPMAHFFKPGISLKTYSGIVFGESTLLHKS